MLLGLKLPNLSSIFENQNMNKIKLNEEIPAAFTLNQKVRYTRASTKEEEKLIHKHRYDSATFSILNFDCNIRDRHPLLCLFLHS